MISFPGILATQRLSIYVDGVALFIRPTIADLNILLVALDIFGEASGLKINYRKSSAILITDDPDDRIRVESLLQCAMGEFPCKYLGLQLAVKKLRKVQW